MAGTGDVVQGTDLSKTITSYWNGRAQSYSNAVNDELDNDRRDAWETAVLECARCFLDDAAAGHSEARAADLGCGPGFFSVLLADAGFAVDAIDGSAEMLKRARKNVAEQNPKGVVAFHECDLLALPFDDETFDVCLSRNVTWLMRDPEAAYAEWLRVLRPGGKLITFDANWYRYLVDSSVDEQRRADQERNVLDSLEEDAQATPDQARRCEEIAAELPLTSIMRPEWDVRVLTKLGAKQVRTDEDAWKRLWTKSEQLYYASSPLFMVEAVKAS